jgi:hypothetical protein
VAVEQTVQVEVQGPHPTTHRGRDLVEGLQQQLAQPLRQVAAQLSIQASRVLRVVDNG